MPARSCMSLTEQRCRRILFRNNNGIRRPRLECSNFSFTVCSKIFVSEFIAAMESSFHPLKCAYESNLPKGNGKKKFWSFGGSRVPPPLRVGANEAVFRILCITPKVRGVIGKKDSIVKQIRANTGAKVMVEEGVLGCEERVIIIVGPVSSKKDLKTEKAERMKMLKSHLVRQLVLKLMEIRMRIRMKIKKMKLRKLAKVLKTKLRKSNQKSCRFLLHKKLC